MDNNLADGVNSPRNPDTAMPTTKNKYISLVASLMALNAAGAITVGGDAAATDFADLDVDSVDSLWDFNLEDIKTVVEVLDTEEGKDANIAKSLPKLANFCDLSA
ncbi:hypothetical protein V2W45_1495129 [Cenococcum geophilum]